VASQPILRSAFAPQSPAGRTCCGYVVQPGPGRQGHDQACMRHEIRVIERDTGPRDSMRQSHLAKELVRERAVDDSGDVRLAAVRALGGGRHDDPATRIIIPGGCSSILHRGL
jgi:hypothetical protein